MNTAPTLFCIQQYILIETEAIAYDCSNQTRASGAGEHPCAFCLCQLPRRVLSAAG